MPNFRDLPVKDRIEWMKSYKKTYPDSSYYDMKSHFDSTSGDQLELQNDENRYSYNVDINRAFVNDDNLKYNNYLGEIEKYGEGMTPSEYNSKYSTQQDFDRWNAKKIRTYNQTEFGNGGKLDNKSTLDIHNTYTVPFGSDSSTSNWKNTQQPSYSPYNKFTIDGSIPISKNFDVTGNLGVGQVNNKSVNAETGIQYGRNIFNNKETETKFNFKGTNIGAGIGVGNDGVYPFAKSKIQMNAKLGNYKNYNTSFNFTPVDVKWTGNQNTDELHYFGLGLSAENKHNGLKAYANVGLNQNGVFDFDHNNDPNRAYDANSTSRNGVNSIEGTIGLSKTFGYPNKGYKYNGVHDNERNLGQFAYGGSLDDGDPTLPKYDATPPTASDSAQVFNYANSQDAYYNTYIKPLSNVTKTEYNTNMDWSQGSWKNTFDAIQGSKDAWLKSNLSQAQKNIIKNNTNNDFIYGVGETNLDDDYSKTLLNKAHRKIPADGFIDYEQKWAFDDLAKEYGFNLNSYPHLKEKAHKGQQKPYRLPGRFETNWLGMVVDNSFIQDPEDLVKIERDAIIKKYPKLTAEAIDNAILEQYKSIQAIPGYNTGRIYYDPSEVKPWNMRTPQEKIDFVKKHNQPKPQVKVEPKPAAVSQPVVNKPIIKQESKPIPPVSEVVKQPIIPVEPKEEYKGNTKYMTPATKGTPNYYFINNGTPVSEQLYYNYYKNYKEVERKEYGGVIKQYQNGGVTYKSQKDYESHLLDPWSKEKQQAQIEWNTRGAKPKYSMSYDNQYNQQNDNTVQPLNKYQMQEQIKQAGKSAVEEANKSIYEDHLNREQFWKDHPGHSEEEKAYIQRKIDNPWLYNPAGTIASLATRMRTMTPEEVEKTYANPIESLKYAAGISQDALTNELAGAAVGKIVDLSQIPFKQLMNNAKNNLLDAGYGIANNPVSKAVTTPINNFRLGIKESLEKTSNMKHITETLSPEEFSKFREIQNLSAQSIDGEIPREKLIQNYLKSSLDDTQISKLTGKTRLELEAELKNPPEVKKAPDPNTFDWAASDDNARRAYANRNAERANNGIPEENYDGPTANYTGNEMSNGTIPGWLRDNMRNNVNINPLRENYNNQVYNNINNISSESLINSTGDFYTNQKGRNTGNKIGNIFKSKEDLSSFVDILPKSENVSNLIPSLFKEKGETTRDIIKRMQNTMTKLKKSDPGFYSAASSMSDNSAPLYYKMASKLNGDPNIKFHLDGFTTLNNMGFLSKSGVEKEKVLDFMNTHLSELQYNGKSLPKAFIKNGNIQIPNLLIQKVGMGIIPLSLFFNKNND